MLGLAPGPEDNDGHLGVAHCSNTACTAATTTTLDSAGNVGHGSSIAIGADGLGLISYKDVSPGTDLKDAHCSNLACTSATTTPIDTAGSTGAFSSIAIGADGLGLISYFEDNLGHLRVAHCSDTACSTATTTVDGTSYHEHSSITIGAAGSA